MKNIINFLRKIGLLHVNSGDYQTGEFDNQSNMKKKNKENSPALNKDKRNKIVFWTLLIFVILFLFLLLISYGFSLWFFIMLATWTWLIKSTKKDMLKGSFIFVKTLTFFIILIIFSILAIVPSDTSNSKDVNLSSRSTEENSDRISVNQASFSSFIFATDPTERNIKNEIVHMTINPIVSFNIGDYSLADKEFLESFEIKNLEFTEKPNVGEVKIIHPKHRSTNESCTGFYFGGCEDKSKPADIKNEGGDIIYELTNSSEIKQDFYDQVSRVSFINPQFKIILHNIGKFDYDAIMKRDGRVDGMRYAEYANIKASDLTSTLEFDVIAKFKDGEKFKKHFIVNFSGDDLIKGASVPAKYK